jgi:hypothetical protein
MRKIILAALVLFGSASLHAQSKDGANINRSKLGLKAGYNWSYIRGTDEGFKSGNKSGFMAGGFYSPAVKSGMGYRTELIFSRQGYSYDNGGQETDIMNDYIYLPQLATFNIGTFMQFQAGGQIGYLLNSKKTTASKDSSITELMNRFDYGFAAGVEISPVRGLILGGRYNLGLGKLHKRYENAATNPYPLPFNPETTDFKNAVIQFFVGYRF